MTLETVGQKIDDVGKVLLPMGESVKKMEVEVDGLHTWQAEVNDRHKTMDEWIRRVETDAQKRGGNNNKGPSPVLEAIPESLRVEARIAEIYLEGNRRSGEQQRDPVDFAGRALWMKSTILSQAFDLQGSMRCWGLDRSGWAKLRQDLANAYGPSLVLQAALGETTAGTGIELILTPVEAEVLRTIKDGNPMRSVARVLPMVSKEHKVPSQDNDLAVAVAGEAAAISDAFLATSFSQKALTAKKITTIGTLSSEVIQDSAIGIIEFVQTLMGEAVGNFETKEGLEGDGTNYTGVNTAAGTNTIAAGANGDVLTYGKLNDARWKARQVDNRKNGAWFMAPEAGGKVTGLVGTNGEPIFKEATLAGAGTRLMPDQAEGMLLGRPLFAHDSIRVDRTKGTGTALTNIYYGNWQKFIIGDLLGITFATDPFGLFTTDQIRVRVVKRTALLVGVPKAFTIVKDIGPV